MAFKLDELNLERFSLDNLYSTYLGMNSREQSIALGVAIGVLFLVVILPITVASSTLGSLKKDLRNGKKELKQIVRKVETYNTAKAELMGIEESLAGGFDSSIATTLESLAERTGIKRSIDSLKEKPPPPSEVLEQATVNVRLKKVMLPEVVSFLFEIENHPTKILRLDSLELKPRFDNKQEFDATFNVSTFRLKSANQENQ